MARGAAGRGVPDNGRMIDELVSADKCAICGGPVSRDRACHLYPKGECVTLCGPACVQDYLLDNRHRDVAHDDRGFLEVALDEHRWVVAGSQ
jgi:hypothetical protein